METKFAIVSQTIRGHLASKPTFKIEALSFNKLKYDVDIRRNCAHRRQSACSDKQSLLCWQWVLRLRQLEFRRYRQGAGVPHMSPFASFFHLTWFFVTNSRLRSALMSLKCDLTHNAIYYTSNHNSIVQITSA